MSPSRRNHKERRPLPNPKLPPNMAKLLVYGVADENYLAYQLGRIGIYLVKALPIETTEDERLIPKIAIIRYNKNEDVYIFLKTTDIYSFRVFKYASELRFR